MTLLDILKKFLINVKMISIYQMLDFYAQEHLVIHDNLKKEDLLYYKQYFQR